MKYSENDHAIALQNLEYLKPGDIIYCNLKHVASSGMSRDIQFFTITDNEPNFLTWSVAVVQNLSTKHEGVHVPGCGMDMGFSVVYNLSRKLFGPGDVNGRDPGYALNYRWI